MEVAHADLKLLEVDEHGFDDVVGSRCGRSSTSSAAVRSAWHHRGGDQRGEGRDRGYLRAVLIQIGFLDRTPRGRVATPLAYGYFGLVAPDERRRESRLW